MLRQSFASFAPRVVPQAVQAASPLQALLLRTLTTHAPGSDPLDVLQKECDENQHKYSNGSYDCDEKRISDIYDEFPGNKYIVTRWNPDNYKVPKGYQKLDRKNRLELDLYVTNKLLNNIGKIKHQIFIIYMFYDEDNGRLSKNIPYLLINSKKDIDDYFLKIK